MPEAPTPAEVATVPTERRDPTGPPDTVSPVWLCPACATANPPTFLYCRKCGQLLPRTE
jgi:hypothetical protein